MNGWELLPMLEICDAGGAKAGAGKLLPDKRIEQLRAVQARYERWELLKDQLADPGQMKPEIMRLLELLDEAYPGERIGSWHDIRKLVDRARHEVKCLQLEQPLRFRHSVA